MRRKLVESVNKFFKDRFNYMSRLNPANAKDRKYDNIKIQEVGAG